MRVSCLEAFLCRDSASSLVFTPQAQSEVLEGGGRAGGGEGGGRGGRGDGGSTAGRPNPQRFKTACAMANEKEVEDGCWKETLFGSG